MKRILLPLLFLLIYSISSAQTGVIQGQVLDDKKQPVAFAAVMIVEDAEGKKPTGKGAKTDMQGRYTIKNLDGGKYNVIAKFIGMPSSIFLDVEVKEGYPTRLDFELVKQAKSVKGDIVIKAPRQTKPIVNQYVPKETIISSEEIKKSGLRNSADIAATTTPGIVQSDQGAALNMGGDRSSGNVTFIDGRKVIGNVSLPPGSINSMEIMLSGVPAKYGDFTGGVTSITTKGPARKLSGSVEVLTSQFLDPFGFNLIGGSLSGPLLRKRNASDSLSPAASSKKNDGDVVLGFAVDGEYQYRKDMDPRIQGSWKVKDNVFQDLVSNPYTLGLDGKSIEGRYDLLRLSDLERISANQNNDGHTLRGNGKLVYTANKDKGIYWTLGGTVLYNNQRNLIERYALLNSDNNPVSRDLSLGGYVKLLMPLYNRDRDTGYFRSPVLNVQAEYERFSNSVFSDRNRFNVFDYGYVGRFEEIKEYNGGINDKFEAFYGPGQSLTFQNAFVSQGFKSKSVNFTPGTQNPLAANLAQKFLELASTVNLAKSIIGMDNAGGLVNGKRADILVQNTFYPYGRTYGGFSKVLNQQFRLTGSINFDFVNKKKANDMKHTLEAGIEIEQRFNTSYSINPIGIWQTAIQQGNSHLNLDIAKNYNPLLIMNSGKDSMRLNQYVNQLNSSNPIFFGNNDTIVYDREVSDGKMTYFGKRFREKFGIDSLTRVNFHEFQPSDFSLNMFSADNMLISNEAPSFFGYNYLGELAPMSTTFFDFFTKKNSEGNYERVVAPYKPLYIATYIQDRFQLKDIAFNLGFRFDYFNSNQYTLKDPYVLNGSVKTSEADPSKFGLNAFPTSVGDAAIYVNDIRNPTQVTGYRNGNRWFSASGQELQSPDLVRSVSGGQIKPLLAGQGNDQELEKRDIRSTNFDPSTIFRTADAIFNIMPRLNFSFKVDSNSLFFAHFDVLTSRPAAGQYITTALNYYNLFALDRTTFINNPELKTPRTTDIEFGFKQKLSTKSSVTINFSYREISNQAQITKRLGAYPKEYLTYDNTDFTTVKTFGLAYELRRTNNLQLRANYSLAFAEGTGSSATSQLSIINAGEGNLKVISPLNFDLRHNINTVLDYRFASGENYHGPQKLKRALENFGVNLNFNLRSGFPYTPQANPTPTAFISSTERAITLGDINSARMPWQMNAILKLDKDFEFKVGKRAGDSTKLDNRKVVGMNVYLQITNLFNSMNALSVYRYTGDPTNDAFLSSPQAELQYVNRENQLVGKGESFRDLYNVALELPTGGSNFRLPRTIQLGAIMSF